MWPEFGLSTLKMGNLECKDIIKQACIYKYTAKVYTEIEEKIGRSRRRKKYQLSWN